MMRYGLTARLQNASDATSAVMPKTLAVSRMTPMEPKYTASATRKLPSTYAHQPARLVRSTRRATATRNTTSGTMNSGWVKNVIKRSTMPPPKVENRTIATTATYRMAKARRARIANSRPKPRLPFAFGATGAVTYTVCIGVAGAAAAGAGAAAAAGRSSATTGSSMCSSYPAASLVSVAASWTGAACAVSTGSTGLDMLDPLTCSDASGSTRGVGSGVTGSTSGTGSSAGVDCSGSTRAGAASCTSGWSVATSSKTGVCASVGLTTSSLSLWLVGGGVFVIVCSSRTAPTIGSWHHCSTVPRTGHKRAGYGVGSAESAAGVATASVNTKTWPVSFS